MDLLALFVAGALLCNALPHLASGLRGETFYTPWARPRGVGRSSALENFLWGAANLLAGVVLVAWSGGHDLSSVLAAIALGFVLAGTGLSIVFGRRQANAARADAPGAGKPPR